MTTQRLRWTRAFFLTRQPSRQLVSAAVGDVAPPPSPIIVADAPTSKLAKRKVALFVAYVGSSFRGCCKSSAVLPQSKGGTNPSSCAAGLQLQITQPGGTVEDVLQEAIYKMGGILPSNHGNLQKIGWSRSSRTDKGVHALANVRNGCYVLAVLFSDVQCCSMLEQHHTALGPCCGCGMFAAVCVGHSNENRVQFSQF